MPGWADLTENNSTLSAYRFFNFGLVWKKLWYSQCCDRVTLRLSAPENRCPVTEYPGARVPFVPKCPVAIQTWRKLHACMCCLWELWTSKLGNFPLNYRIMKWFPFISSKSTCSSTNGIKCIQSTKPIKYAFAHAELCGINKVLHFPHSSLVIWPLGKGFASEVEVVGLGLDTPLLRK